MKKIIFDDTKIIVRASREMQKKIDSKCPPKKIMQTMTQSFFFKKTSPLNDATMEQIHFFCHSCDILLLMKKRKFEYKAKGGTNGNEGR